MYIIIDSVASRQCQKSALNYGKCEKLNSQQKHDFCLLKADVIQYFGIFVYFSHVSSSFCFVCLMIRCFQFTIIVNQNKCIVFSTGALAKVAHEMNEQKIIQT